MNRVTKVGEGQLRQFVVTAPVAANGASINIYPALIPGGVGYVSATGAGAVQYQTVDFSPINGANISVVTLASSVYRKNVAYVPEAIALATADLEMPKGVHEVAREEFDGVSMRMLTDYYTPTDQMITRLDVLYGYVFIRPEWCVAVGDAV